MEEKSSQRTQAIERAPQRPRTDFLYRLSHTGDNTCRPVKSG